VTDNAQSIFELSQVESTPGAAQEIEKQFGFKPDFEKGKHYLEDNDGAGNTFKATAKPVLIATAVAGATTMLFSIILTLQKHFGLDAERAAGLQARPARPYVLLGLLMGGGTVYWFTGASIQAGDHRGLPRGRVHQEEHQARLGRGGQRRDVAHGRAHLHAVRTGGHVQHLHGDLLPDHRVRVLQRGVLHRLPRQHRRRRPVPGRLHGERRRRVGQRQEGRRGGAERQGHRLHDASIVGDTVGDPYKDTSSVALNPIIKFTTLFGLLAVEMAVANPGSRCRSPTVFMLIALFFVYRSFYGMRISSAK
jgi:K(+)-stimulated pyrophosphate-energized sodium pump